MKISKVILPAIIAGLLTTTSAMAFSQLSGARVDTGSIIAAPVTVDEIRKARQLNISVKLYREIGIAAQGSDSFYHFENTIDIKKHPAFIEYSNITSRGEAVPNALMFEVLELSKYNYKVIATQLELSKDKFFQLLTGYIILNDKFSALDRSNPKNKLSLGDNYTKNTVDDPETDDPDPVEEEVVEVIQVTGTAWLEVFYGGAHNMLARWNRDASVRWGGGTGVVTAVFDAGHSTLVRQYRYSNGFLTPFNQVCMGQCVASIGHQ